MKILGGKVYHRLARILRTADMKYETELYSVLLLMVLFLVLVNLSSIRVVSQLRGVFENQIYTDLLKAARHSAAYLSDRPESASSTDEWREFVKRSFADGIELIEVDAIDPASLPSAWGRLTSAEIEMLADGDPLSVSPDDETALPGYAVLFPFEATDGRSFILSLHKRANQYGIAANVARFNLLFHLSGLLAVILLGYLYLRVTLRPYHKMKRAATGADQKADKREVSVEQIVATFTKMIEELKEKEEILQDLYRKTQKRADRLEQFNEYILDGMASGLISCNREELVTHFNRAAQKLLGIGEQQAIGLHFRDVLSQTPELIEVIAQTFEKGLNSSRSELSIDSEDGRTMSLGVSTTLIVDERGRKVGTTVIMTDLTEIKRLQKDIAYKEKMAALGETAAGLAHELRNSMTAVVGFGKLMRRLAGNDPQLLQVAESISREASATEQMLTRFLEFAQPASLLMDEVDAAQVISDVIDGLRSKASLKGVLLQGPPRSDAVHVWGDQLAVRQVLANLVVNAIDASEPGGWVRIDVRTDEDAKSVAVSVSDSGPGIPKHLRHKVFSPFFTTKGDGTGLGLCTVRKFVMGMNGTVELSLPDEENFAVTVTLPKSRAGELMPEMC